MNMYKVREFKELGNAEVRGSNKLVGVVFLIYIYCRSCWVNFVCGVVAWLMICELWGRLVLPAEGNRQILFLFLPFGTQCGSNT